MEWPKLINRFAPMLATAAGGPFAGTAVKVLIDALLPDKVDADEGDLQEAIQNATPEVFSRIKQVEADFKVKMKELNIKEKDLLYKDIQSARKMFGVNIYPQIILSAVFIIGYFLILGKVMGQAITLDEGMKALVFTLIGVITGEIPRIMAFWFGSSMGSKEKTEKALQKSQ